MLKTMVNVNGDMPLTLITCIVGLWPIRKDRPVPSQSVVDWTWSRISTKTVLNSNATTGTISFC